MKDVNIEFGIHTFDARIVAAKTQEQWLACARKNSNRTDKTPEGVEDDTYPDLSDDQLKEVHAKCTKAVAEADGVKQGKPAPDKNPK